MRSLKLGDVRKAWCRELFAYEVYKYIASRYGRKTFHGLARIELGHARLWEEVARDLYGVRLRRSLTLKLRVLATKALIRLFGYGVAIKLSELVELTAISTYVELADKAPSEVRGRVRELLVDEIKHEVAMLSDVLRVDKDVRGLEYVVLGSACSVIGVESAISGLAGVFRDALAVGAGGAVALLAGLFTTCFTTYLVAKTLREASSLRDVEASARVSVMPSEVVEEVVSRLKEVGLPEYSEGLVREALATSKDLLKNLYLRLKHREVPGEAISRLRLTCMLYLPASATLLAPFYLGMGVVAALAVSIALSVIMALSAGVLTAILAGVPVGGRAALMGMGALGAAVATYLVGAALRAALYFPPP